MRSAASTRSATGRAKRPTVPAPIAKTTTNRIASGAKAARPPPEVAALNALTSSVMKAATTSEKIRNMPQNMSG
jgi:hypothetical protein